MTVIDERAGLRVALDPTSGSPPIPSICGVAEGSVKNPCLTGWGKLSARVFS